MGMPNSSPMRNAHGRSRLHHHMLGGIVQGRPYVIGISLFSLRAPVGQAAMHCPQLMQGTSARDLSKAGAMVVVKPR